MIKIALIGGASHYHARSFSGLVNEHDREAWSAAGMPAFEGGPFPHARISAIWDPDRAAARELAELAQIEHVLDTMESAIGLVDGVIITDDVTMQHQKRARPFLEAGLPTFIDKPLSSDPAEAADLVALARRAGSPLMSCSALRYAKELSAARDAIRALGQLACATATGPGELVFYGIHPLELAHTVMGPGIISARNIGDKERALVQYLYADGRFITLQVLGPTRPGLSATFYGENGCVHIAVQDHGYYYRAMLEAFVEMVATRTEPIPLETTLEIIRCLSAGKQSLAEKGALLPLARA